MSTTKWTPAIGDRNLVRAGFAWHVYAYFACNAAGVRVAVRKSSRGAERFALAFAKKNNVATSWVVR